MHALSLLALLLPFAAANPHKRCDCMSWTQETGWIHNADLTHWVCKVYYKEVDYNSRFDASTGRCVVDGSLKIDGQTWENQCKEEASGYFRLDPTTGATLDVGKGLLKVSAAVGSCPDRD
ncbi:hypothetical protein E4U30_001148 [Claviceps sp. LM220 group G6]|nr:hypothetical protein E4U15_003885 [Claviceps sp. LM218 group G6]KAG6096919.1 hypothetical protein E4U30_001148 [Claviceps sp. LM220 group G6]